MAAIHEIVFDCDAPALLAGFWSELLDGYAIRPTDQAEAMRLAALGLPVEEQSTVMLDGPGPSLCFQNIEGRRPENNRVHFDIAVTDRGSDVERLKSAGAEPIRVLPTCTVMRDPEGNQFVLVDTKQAMAA